MGQDEDLRSHLTIQASMSRLLSCILPTGSLWFCNGINNSLIPSCLCWVFHGIATLRNLYVYVHISVADIYYLSLCICCHHTKIWQQLCVLGLPSPTHMGSAGPGGKHSSQKDSGCFESWGTRSHALWSCPRFSCLSGAHKCLRLWSPFKAWVETEPSTSVEHFQANLGTQDGKSVEVLTSCPSLGQKEALSKLRTRTHWTITLYFEFSMEPEKILRVVTLCLWTVRDPIQTTYKKYNLEKKRNKIIAFYSDCF